LALMYEMQNRTDDVIEVYRKLIEANPFGLEARFKLGKAYLDLNRYGEAEKEFKEILSRDSTNLDARFSLGLVYFFEGANFDGAIQEFSSVLAKDPLNDRARYFLASSCEEQGEHGRAFREFQEIPPGSKLYESARIQMGMILKDGGRVREAIDLIKTALDKKGNSDELLGFLAALHEEDGDVENAEGILKRGLLFLPQSANLHYRLGVLYENAGRHEESMREMEEVLKIDEDNAEALNFIGYSYADRGIKLDEAQRMIQKALRLKPNNGFITDSLGWLYFKQNKMDLAIRYLEKALSLIPDDPTITEHLGDAYARAGLYRKALATYRKALKLKPRDSETLMAKIKGVIEQAARQGRRPEGKE
ncbi:MAG: tetratricopeptide repeat protein, partial [Deltaproteobacteria bacterium]|nr:tetratricopeptide repeat protein [Deltaproteobacteria bacterium]